jgi:hypothetical protein
MNRLMANANVAISVLPEAICGAQDLTLPPTPEDHSKGTSMGFVDDMAMGR